MYGGECCRGGAVWGADDHQSRLEKIAHDGGTESARQRGAAAAARARHATRIERVRGREQSSCAGAEVRRRAPHRWGRRVGGVPFMLQGFGGGVLPCAGHEVLVLERSRQCWGRPRLFGRGREGRRRWVGYHAAWRRNTYIGQGWGATAGSGKAQGVRQGDAWREAAGDATSSGREVSAGSVRR